MDLTRYFEEFSEALLHAYSIDGLERMLRFQMNVKLDDVVGPGPGAKRAFELIEWCEQAGRVDELFASALKSKPGNPKLRALAEKLRHDVDASHLEVERQIRESHLQFDSIDSPDADRIREITQSVAGDGGLQAVAVAAPGLATGEDVESWLKQYELGSQRVCSVGINGAHSGTGFLIRPDLVMTNSHVIGETQLSAGDCVFDYKGDAVRNQLPKYKIVGELLRSGPKELDFVVLRLDRIPDGNRGGFSLKEHDFDTVRESIHLLGHPNGQSLRLSYGVVFDNNSFIQRVAYTANTAGGSSGSPVFRQNWELVAIHHHGETGVNNHGIPMKWIVPVLKDKGIL